MRNDDDIRPYEAEECEDFRWKAWRNVAYEFYKGRVTAANRARFGAPMEEERRWLTLDTSRLPTEEESTVFKRRVQSLAVMYGTVERFTKDFQAFSFNVAKGRQADLLKLEFSNPPADTSEWPPLSVREQIRLQRGLLRYELCCHLLGRPFMLRENVLTKARLYRDDDPYWFIRFLMAKWELQEIFSVRTYVQRKYDLFHLHTQKGFIDDIQNLGQRTASDIVKDAASQPCAVAVSEESQRPVLSFWHEMCSIKGPSILWVDGMSRLGLTVLQNVLWSDAQSWPRLHGAVVNWTDSLAPRCQLPDSLAIANYSEWMQPEVRRRRGQAMVPLIGANSIFLAALNQRHALVKSRQCLKHGTIRLQELGWVFWEDRTRLSTLHLRRGDDDKRHPKYHVAQYFRDEIPRPIRYRVQNFWGQVKEAVITTDDWKNIIVPKYGFRAPDGRNDFTWVKNILG